MCILFLCLRIFLSWVRGATLGKYTSAVDSNSKCVCVCVVRLLHSKCPLGVRLVAQVSVYQLSDVCASMHQLLDFCTNVHQLEDRLLYKYALIVGGTFVEVRNSYQIDFCTSVHQLDFCTGVHKFAGYTFVLVCMSCPGLCHSACVLEAAHFLLHSSLLMLIQQLIAQFKGCHGHGFRPAWISVFLISEPKFKTDQQFCTQSQFRQGCILSIFQARLNGKY